MKITEESSLFSSKVPNLIPHSQYNGRKSAVGWPNGFAEYRDKNGEKNQ